MSASPTLTTHAQAPKWKVWSALGIVYVVWGSTYLAIRIVVDTMPALLTAAARFLIAGAILFVIGKKVERVQEISAVHWRSAFIIGGALLLGGNGAVVVAEETVSSGVAALMIASIPLWFAVHSRIWLKERIGRRAVLGIVIGFAGIAVLSWPRSGSTQIDPFGAMLLVFAPIAWSAGSLYSKKARQASGPLTSTGMQMLAGGVTILIASLLRGEMKDIAWNEFSVDSWLAFIYLIVFGSFAAFTAYMWVLKNAPTSLVSTYAYVNPVVAIFLGWSVLGEVFTGITAIAAVIILVGVVLMVTSPAPKPVSEEQRPIEAG